MSFYFGSKLSFYKSSTFLSLLRFMSFSLIILSFMQKKVSYSKCMRLLKKLAATYSPAFAVPSALVGLTSVFGMGTGEPHR